MPVKGLLFIILIAAFVGGLFSGEITTWLKNTFSKDKEEKE